MNAHLKAAIIKSVQDLNARYPGNKNYHIVDEDNVGPFSVYSTEFDGDKGGRFTNFTVVKGNNVMRSFYYLSDVVRYIDRGLGWRSLFIDQFALVIGSLMILVLVAGLMVMLIETGQAPEPLWVAVSSGIGYLFGSKGTLKTSRAKAP